MAGWRHSCVELGQVYPGCVLCVLCVDVQTDGCTPLYGAGLNGHVEVVRALVELGASVNQARVRDWLGVVLQLVRCVSCACTSR